MKRYRFYTTNTFGQQRYLQDDCESYTPDRRLAGLFTEQDWLRWGDDGELQREELAEDEQMHLIGAPMLPGLA